MSTATPPPASTVSAARPDAKRQSSGKFLRQIWRYHFYAALFTAPFLVLLAITGLVILYTPTINDVQHRSLLLVTPGSSTVSLDDQKQAAAAAFPDLTVDLVVPPAADDRSTFFEFTDGDSLYMNVYVDPYTGQVLGSYEAGNDIVGLANRLHGFLNNDSVNVTLPSLSHLISSDNPATVEIKVGDLILEVISVWGLVLALTGLYLWWPRKSQKGKPVVRVRWSKGGRLRWRDLHTTSGLLLCLLLVGFVVTGMPWSDYWGADWANAASKITPNAEPPSPQSTGVSAGAVDRLGHRIPWAIRTDEIPASTGEAVAAPMSLQDVTAVAASEGMLPGYSILLPMDDLSDPENPVYGTYQLSNPWPGQVQAEGVVYLDQFTGQTVARTSDGDWGTLNTATEFGVQNHMGTQFGLLSRILATLGCLLIIFSFISAVMLWWKRRPAGTMGLPKQASRRKPAAVVVVIAIALAVIYPIWGASLLVVVAIDALIHFARRGKRSQDVSNVSETV